MDTLEKDNFYRGLAAFFIIIQTEKIEQFVGIKHPFSDIAMEIIANFISQNHDEINAKYKTIYDALSDDVFCVQILEFLKKAKTRGIPLTKPRITYVD